MEINFRFVYRYFLNNTYTMASKKFTYRSSITNQSQGGGNKKAGLAIAPLSASVRIAYNIRGLPQTLTEMQRNTHGVVCQSRSVGSRMRMMCF
jgi:hypothetical protein